MLVSVAPIVALSICLDLLGAACGLFDIVYSVNTAQVNRSVVALRLRDNGLTDESVEVLTAAIKSTWRITELDLSENRISLEGCVCIEQILSRRVG